MNPSERSKRLKELTNQDESKLSSSELEEVVRLRQSEDREKPLEARRSRVRALQEKRTKSQITRSESEELVQEERAVSRHEALNKRFEERKRDRETRRSESQKSVSRENPTLKQDPETLAEFKSHAERLAKLERARDVAEADERKEVVTKIDTLIAKENQRHQTWLANRNTKPNTQ